MGRRPLACHRLLGLGCLTWARRKQLTKVKSYRNVRQTQHSPSADALVQKPSVGQIVQDRSVSSFIFKAYIHARPLASHADNSTMEVPGRIVRGETIRRVHFSRIFSHLDSFALKQLLSPHCPSSQVLQLSHSMTKQKSPASG